MKDCIMIKFDETVKVAGKEVAELEARKPIMRDIKVASERYNPSDYPVAWEMLIISNLAGITEQECEELEPVVYAHISAQIKPFLS